jgi:hypothetical protein
MTLRLNGSTSGYTEIDAPAVAGSNTITLPTGAGSANQFLKNGSTAGSLGWSSMVEDSSGRLLVGTSTARSNLFNTTYSSLFQVEAANSETLGRTSSFIYGDSNTSGPIITFGKHRGTSVGGNTVVQSGDECGRIIFQGSDGTEFVQAAVIAAEVDGTPGANDMPGRLMFSTTADGASSPTERMRILSTGRIAFNSTDTPDNDRVTIKFLYGVDGAGLGLIADNVNAFTQVRFKNPNGTVGSIVTTGSATSYGTSSDYRLKENVTPVTNGITRLLQLKPSRFNFIADPDHRVDGFIAHEAQAVVPECVTGIKDEVDADGNPVHQGIDQSKLVPLLTAALQEAIAKIESLETRLTALEVTP